MGVPGEDLVASVGRNTFFGMIAAAARIGTRMVMVPVVVSYLGIEGYGIWAIIMAIMAYMQIGVSGVRSAFQKYVAEATGTSDYHRVSVLLSTGFAVSFGVYFVALLPVAIFAGDLVGAIGVPAPFLSSTASAVIVLFVAVNIGNIGGFFESIIMGAHRIDLVNKLDLVLLCAEAAAVMLLVANGFGLLAMTVVVACSQLVRAAYVFFKSSRVLPQVRVRLRFFSPAALPELLRFAGSFQVLHIVEVGYLNMLPFVALKFFGAQTAGLLAVCTKLAEAAGMAPQAMLLPLLSGGTLVNYSTRFDQKRADFIKKALKATTTLALPLFAFVMIFGEQIVFAWTGEKSELILTGLILISFVSLLRVTAKVCFVLYRSSGRASKDLFWQLLRLVLLGSAIAIGGRELGFLGLLVAAVFAELFGMIFMLKVIISPNRFVQAIRLTVPKTFHLLGVVALSLSISVAVASFAVEDSLATERLAIALRVLLGFAISVALTAVILWSTNYFSTDEREVVTKSLASIFRKSASALN